ncbi:MAG: hypothetical protein R3D66_00275 [Alphaproteobacteria bacterium]
MKKSLGAVLAGPLAAFSMNVDAQNISSKTVPMHLPDGRHVTFNCGDLGPRGELTGKFLATADYTNEEQINAMKNVGRYEEFLVGKKDPNPVYMIRHLAGHKGEHKYCTDQANQLRTGTFINTGAPCPPVDALKACMGM